VEATAAALRDPTNLEYDLETGNRGDRTDHVRGWLTRRPAPRRRRSSGNAAAVFSSSRWRRAMRCRIARRTDRDRGAFHMPDIAARAGCWSRSGRRTDPRCRFRGRHRPWTAMRMMVHPSTMIEGFTAPSANPNWPTCPPPQPAPR
jgi:L-seryl-tRNA(Ser) seleniumtransferase